MGTIIKKLKLSFFYITMLIASFVFAIVKNNADLDLWHRMAVGKIFSQSGRVAFHDIFAYFPVKPLWVDHEWLSGVVFYNIAAHFGDYGFVFLKTCILFAIIVLIFKTNQLISPEPEKARIAYYLIILYTLIISLMATLRCQAFTYLFFTFWIYLLERVRRGENRLIWIFPATTLLWANMHAGFLAGFGLIVFYATGEFFNKKNPAKYLGILALCFLVTFINPYGFKYWPYLIEATTMPRPFITEWEPLRPFSNIFTIIGTKILLLFTVPGFLSYRIISKDKKYDWVAVIAFFVTLYLGIKHSRHIMFFSIIVAVFGYKYFVFLMDLIFNGIKNKILALIPKQKHHLLYFGKFIFVYGFVLSLFTMLVFSYSPSIRLSQYPTKAFEFIKINNLKGNLFVPFNWGSYAMWKLYPQNLISIDGRYEETYTNQSYLDASAITFHHENWEKVFNKYHHDVVILYRDTDTEKALRNFKNWKLVYEDKKAVVFVPASTPDREWVQPTQDEEYYINTKYENSIDFKKTKL